MNLGNFSKQPAEVLDYDLDYSQWLTTGDNVQSAAVVVVPDTDLVVESVFVNDPRVKLWISGGADGTAYKLTVTVTTADGRVKEDEFRIKVRDR